MKNKIYRTGVRIVIFLLLYIPLFTIPFYTGKNFLTPIIVGVSFFLSKPITKYIISKFLPRIMENNK
jgi:hypothetical protein